MKYIEEKNELYSKLSSLQQLAWQLQENIFNQFNRDYTAIQIFVSYFQSFLTINEVFYLIKWLTIMYNYFIIAADLDEKSKNKKR